VSDEEDNSNTDNGIELDKGEPFYLQMSYTSFLLIYFFFIVKTISLRRGREKALAINFHLVIFFLGLLSILAHYTYYNVAHIIVFLNNRGKNLLF